MKVNGLKETTTTLQNPTDGGASPEKKIPLSSKPQDKKQKKKVCD
jgi:hypothetical protein